MHEWYGYELLKRANNFFIDFKSFEREATEDITFYMDLYDLKNQIIIDLNDAKNLDQNQILETVFTTIFDFITEWNDRFPYFKTESPLHSSVYESCFFTSLCMFLNKSKRIKGISLNKFTYDNSLKGYNKESSINYCPENFYSDILTKEGDNLRMARHSRLSNRPVYNIRPQWSAMPPDSVHEWELFFPFHSSDVKEFNLQNDWASQHNLSYEEFQIAKDTFKRIGSLYNDINKAVDLEKKDGYEDKVKELYQKFYSKLKKIKYENFLLLQKVLLLYICEDKRYYGINLYRLEKELKPFILINEVNSLSACKDKKEEEEILFKSVIMRNICYPRLYDNFSPLPLPDIGKLTKKFFSFQDYIVKSSILIIDELIEKGYFNEDWETLICETINKMTESVFYDPKQINYNIATESQEEFMKILLAPVHLLLQTTGITFT